MAKCKYGMGINNFTLIWLNGPLDGLTATETGTQEMLIPGEAWPEMRLPDVGDRLEFFLASLYRPFEALPGRTAEYEVIEKSLVEDSCTYRYRFTGKMSTRS